LEIEEFPMKKALVCGAGGFIGSHLVKRLVEEGFWVRGVDLKAPEFSPTIAQDFVLGDLRDPRICDAVVDREFDEVYQLAADMGGAGFVFTGDNDAQILHNNALINLNMAEVCSKSRVGRMFYSSSACVYPEYNQKDPDNPICSEDSAYPAAPDSEYGWEKLFSERLYLSYYKNKKLNIHISRYHNIFGPEGTWTGGREKAPAAISRKVAMAVDGDTIEIWGSGKQTRSFLYIDECIEGTLKLMRSDYHEPLNIGSTEMISINDLTKMVADISSKNIAIKNVPGPLGVQGRNSDNRKIRSVLGWEPSLPLRTGMIITYDWVREQVRKANG
jgi:nucleoside-diphosphate-sugar epimerase